MYANPWKSFLDAPYAFCRGMHPVIEPLILDIRTALGITTNAFTIELYCREGTVSHVTECHSPTNLRQEYFYSPVSVGPCVPYSLGNRAPHEWGIRRSVAGICRVHDDTNLFYENGKPCSSLYFRTFCTIPVYAVCTTNIIGVLVVTSMQEEALAVDALEVLQFIASLISQYIASHNRCVAEYTDSTTPRISQGGMPSPRPN